MSDAMDRAQAHEEEMRSDALAAFERRAHGHPPRVSAEFCSVCDEPIPTARRITLPGVQTCVDCQHDIEKKHVFDWGMAE